MSGTYEDGYLDGLPEVGVRSRCSIGERGDNEWTRYKEERR